MSQMPKGKNIDPPVKGGGSKASQLCIRSEHGSQHQMEERERIPTGQMTHISDFILVCVIRKVVFKLGHF